MINYTIEQIEERLSSLWRKVLGIDRLESNQNFFALGGHSLLAIDLLNEVEDRLGVRLNMKDVVEAPTIKEMAHAIKQRASTAISASSASVPQTGLYPLTLNQKQVWSLNVLYPDSVTHNISTAIRINRKLDIGLLTEAINLIVERQESLRTRFKVVQGVPYQEIIPEYRYRFSFIDIKEEDLKGEIQKQMKFVFKLDQAPLMRVMFYRLKEDEYVFFFMVHHIVWDGLSNTFFFHEFIEIYEKLERGEKLELAPVKMTYKEHAQKEALYLNSDEFNEQKNAWKEILSGKLPVLNLPTDYPRPSKINNSSSTVYFELSFELLNKLEEYVQKRHISLYNVFFAAYNVLISKISGEKDLIIGTPVHGRHYRDVRKTFGYFINTLPVRTKLESSKSFKDNLGLTLQSLQNAFYNQSVPLDIVIKNANIENDPSRTPLFQTLFIYLDVTKELDVFKKERLEQVKVERYSTHTEIDFYLYKSREKVDGVIEFRKDLYSPETIKKVSDDFVVILESILTDEYILLKKLGVPEGVEESGPVYPEVDTRPYNQFVEAKAFHDLFEKQAQINPAQTALWTQELNLNYEELNYKATSLAETLIKNGVQKGDLVGVSTKRNEKMLVSLLAVLKAGAGYVPLDPAFPDERLAHMIKKSGMRKLLAEEALFNRFSFEGMISYEQASALRAQGDVALPAVDLNQTAYVLFTSGSTGAPKGVEVSHKNVLNFLLSMKDKPGFKAGDRLLSVTTFSFDISVLELFLPLISGGSVYIANEQEIIDGDKLAAVIENKDINCMQATPTTWRLLLASAWKKSPGLKVLCGGEPLPRDLAEKLLGRVAELWNMYGPTETTVWSTIKKISSSDRKMLIGTPIANTSVYVLDDEGQMCPYGVEGNLFIGGQGVAKGYINDSEQTSRRFIDNPFRTGEKMYNTGDRARLLPDGELECLGRSDDQVKIRGYRIELGEIETAILEEPSVNECAVKVYGQKIIGHVSLKPSMEFDEEKLKAVLKKKLPHYMIPSCFAVLESLPKTLNGKIDKKSLSEKMVKKEGRGQQVEVGGEVVTYITSVWEKVLEQRDLDIDENFFNLGGHSISAVEIFGLINEKYSLDLPLSSIFESSTIRELSQIVECRIRQRIVDISELKCIVAIKTCLQPRESVFCFHGVGGNVLNYYRLADYIGDRNFYGIQSLGVSGGDQVLETIPEMARLYIKEIKNVQPKGPYILAGGSMGGMVALEVAIQLKAMGDQIKELVMFDTFGPSLDFEIYGSVKVNFLKRTTTSLKFKYDKMINYLKLKFYLFTKESIPHSVRYFSIEDKNFLALRRYRPSVFEGNITLIRAPKRKEGWYADPYMGWRSIINGKIETIEIEGDHQNFIESPSLAIALADVMKKI